MRIGMYPFTSGASIEHNLKTIEKGAATAAAANVTLLVFHECALCGYPPIETAIEKIHPEEIDHALSQVACLANKFGLCIAMGSVRYQNSKCFNSIVVFDNHGSRIGVYDKSALWGWDTDHFTRGSSPGIFDLNGIKIGFRICYDIRFPELFRMLYLQNVNLCVVCFSDTNEKPDMERYEIIKAHLLTRAVENAMTVLSVNSISRNQTAPTAVFSPSGRMLLEAPVNQEGLVLFDYQKPEPTFSMKGIVANIGKLAKAANEP